MPSTATFLAVSLIALGMVLTPGPNMVYLISRSITQGRAAGVISLIGVILGFVFYVFAAAFGLQALVLAVPLAYDIIRWAGAAYLLYLAWTSVKPGARSPLQPRLDLPHDGPHRLLAMGFFTNLLNPKIAVLYLSLIPQFIDPAAGPVLMQFILLGLTQIAVSFTVNLAIVFACGSFALWLATRPAWLAVQRWFMGGVLAALAVRLALEPRPA